MAALTIIQLDMYDVQCSTGDHAICRRLRDHQVAFRVQQILIQQPIDAFNAKTACFTELNYVHKNGAERKDCEIIHILRKFGLRNIDLWFYLLNPTPMIPTLLKRWNHFMCMKCGIIRSDEIYRNTVANPLLSHSLNIAALTVSSSSLSAVWPNLSSGTVPHTVTEGGRRGQ